MTNISMLLLAMILCGPTQGKHDYHPSLKGPYLGQKPPGRIPTRFAPGILSSELIEFQAAFPPAGKELYYSRFTKEFKAVIMTMKVDKGVWTNPVEVSFSGQFSDSSPCFSPDGKKLYFMSKRPRQSGGPEEHTASVWAVERQGDSWSEPVSLGYPESVVEGWWTARPAADGYFYFVGRT